MVQRQPEDLSHYCSSFPAQRMLGTRCASFVGSAKFASLFARSTIKFAE
jgi:hypothetical protein